MLISTHTQINTAAWKKLHRDVTMQHIHKYTYTYTHTHTHTHTQKQTNKHRVQTSVLHFQSHLPSWNYEGSINETKRKQQK